MLSLAFFAIHQKYFRLPCKNKHHDKADVVVFSKGFHLIAFLRGNQAVYLKSIFLFLSGFPKILSKFLYIFPEEKRSLSSSTPTRHSVSNQMSDKATKKDALKELWDTIFSTDEPFMKSNFRKRIVKSINKFLVFSSNLFNQYLEMSNRLFINHWY